MSVAPPTRRGRSQGAASSAAEASSQDDGDAKAPSTDDRRVLRAHYRILKASIAEEKEHLVGGDSSTFDSIVRRADDLHHLVHKPREQIADAEALLDITDAFLSSVKESRRGRGAKAADLITALLNSFGQALRDDGEVNLNWHLVGLEASVVLHDAPGMCSMLGPMDVEPKKRKVAAPRKRTRDVFETARPETVEDGEGSEQTQTDKNIRTMFNVLRKCGKNGCFLEHLILSRDSFAKTVENLFFLSFLVKDGRAQIAIEGAKHIVAIRYAPTAAERSARPNSGSNGPTEQVVNQQFVFRYDHKDWMIMKETVEKGEELMPARSKTALACAEMVMATATATAPTTTSTPAMATPEHQTASAATASVNVTPIRMNTRNRGRVTLGEFEELNLSIELGDCEDSDDGEHDQRANDSDAVLHRRRAVRKRVR